MNTTKLILFFPFLSFLINGEVFAQQLTPSKQPLGGVVTVKEIKNDFAPALIHFDEVNPAMIQQKELKRIEKNSGVANRKSDSRSFLYPPVIFKSFEAPATSPGWPNDNDIAISNDGYIISVINSEIHIYDTTGNKLKVISLNAFADTLKLSGGEFDPRVIYDPEEDRFIIVFLKGVSAADSRIVVGFSVTNNPLLSWNLYAFAGNMLNDSSMSDFPNIAITHRELFINVSNYDENSFGYTDYLYKGTRVLQIKKKDGYEGSQLNYLYHHNFSFEPSLHWKNNFMQLIPVKGGGTLYGPNMFLLAIYDSKPKSDTMYLVELTDTIGAPGFSIKTELVKTPAPYHLPPLAIEIGNHPLYTNFNTILSSFYANGSIQFTKNDMDSVTGHAAIYHGFIKNAGVTNDITIHRIASDTLDLAYPSIVYVGKSSADDDALISFNHTSITRYPGNSALFYKNDSYSDIVTLKKGLSLIYYSGDPIQRWGDYTGAQKRYNRDNEVWVGASFGKSGMGKTWISCVKVNEGASAIQSLQPGSDAVNLYPNPAADKFSIEFSAPVTEHCRFELFDAQGKLIRLLLQDRVEKGGNSFAFNQTALDNGIYFLKITGNSGNLLLSRKLVFQK